MFESLISAYFNEMKQQRYKYVANLADVHNSPAILAIDMFGVKRKRIYLMLLPFGLHFMLGGPIGKGELVPDKK